MNLRDKIEQLRQQPEHIRLRTATVLTGVSGVALVVLWLVVLLPLQLKFSNPSPKTAPQQAKAPKQSELALPPSTLPTDGVVSGVQSWQENFSPEVLPESAVAGESPAPVLSRPLVLESPSMTPSPSPVIEVSPTAIAPSPNASSVPVQITR